MTQLLSITKKMINGLGDLFFPRYCMICERTLSSSTNILCKQCVVNLPYTNFEKDLHNPLFQAFWGRSRVEFAASAFYFRSGENLQHLIHLLKYRHRPDIGLFLGKIIGQLILKSENFNNIDYIIPVPLHNQRLRKRGYNQSEEIAYGISEILDIEVLPNILFRSRYNVTQTHKKHYERWENVDGIFELRDFDFLVNKNILLVDDVFTTGSTLEACVAPLNKVLGLKVFVFVVGYTSSK